MTADIGVEKPQPTWPIAVALGISGLLFFLYIYTLIAPIIRNPNIIAPYSTRQAGRSKRKSKSSWLSRWLLGAGTPRHLQPITPSQSRTSRRTANRDLESSPSSSTSHTHGYFPSSPSSAKLSPHPITRSHPSFQHTFNPSYNTLHTPLTPSFSTSPTGVRVSRLDYDLPSHTPHVRGGQHTLSPPPPAYVSSPNSPSPDYTPVFVEQTSGCTTPPMSPGTYPTRAPSAEGGASTMSYYSPSALASPSASSFYGTVSRSPSSHSFTSGLPPPSPSYNGSAAAPATLAVPPFTRGPVGRSISGSSTGSPSSASMYSASSALHQSPPSSQDNPSPPPRQGHLDAAQATLREDGPAQKPPPRVLTKRGADKGQDNDTLEHFPLPPPLTIRTTNTGPYTPKITTSVSVHAVGSRTTQYWPPGSQLPTPPVSAAPSSESESYPHPPKPPQPSSPSFPTVNHPYSPPSPREIRESLSDSAIHTLTPERLARQPILAAHMYARNESGAPMVHLRATPTIRGTAGKM